MTDTNKPSGIVTKVRKSTTFKMLIVGFLILVLLIPLSFIKSLIYERKNLQQNVVSEINKSWGDEIIFYGPILEIPYKTYTKSSVTDSKTGKTSILVDEAVDYAYFFPKALNIDGNIETEMKHKGMYTTSVYTTRLGIQGEFTFPDFEALEIPTKDVLWNKAKILIQTTNLKGIKDALNIEINQKSIPFESSFTKGTKKDYYGRDGRYRTLEAHKVITKSIPLKDLFEADSLDFTMKFNVSGSSRFQIIPIGKETTMHVQSNWKDAGFEGEYLPYNPDKIKENGFDAHWKVLQMNRAFSQQFTYLPDLDEYAFGVNFFIPVDDYQQSERTTKYGYLVISLTFLLFFLIQTLSKIDIHAFQYLMIGLALVIFYTLLISISEHSNFAKAYLISSLSVILLISLYSKAIMKNWKFPIFIGLSLSSLYGFIFVIIQLENYALLVGSIGLFAILAVVMFASRKIEWN